MSGSFLGSKKLKKIESILGKKVRFAVVREHYWATVSVEGDDVTCMVNYKTGNVVLQEAAASSGVKAQEAFDRAWQNGASELEALAVAEQVQKDIWGE